MLDPQSRAAVGGFDEPKLEALIETMFLAAYADGEFSDEERKHFVKSVESLTSGRIGGDKLEALLGSIQRALDASDREARLAAVKARLRDARERKVALSLAIELMAADGILRTTERELIFEAAEALDVDRDAAADLVKQASR